MKRFFKGKKGKELTKQTPRPIDEIKRAHAEVSQQAANAQYSIFVYTKQLEQINMTLVSLNQEADARQKLDAETAKLAQAAKETANVQPQQ